MKRTTVIVNRAAYEVRARAYERFAKEAWEVRLRPPRLGGGRESSWLAAEHSRSPWVAGERQRAL